LASLPGGLDRLVTIDEYAVAFTDSHLVETDGIFVEAPLSLHRALSAPWEPPCALAHAGALILAHSLWALPAATDDLAERLAIVLSWFCGSATVAVQSSATSASPAMTLAGATSVVEALACVCFGVGLGARLPETGEADAIAREALKVAGGGTMPNSRAFAKWAVTANGVHSLLTRWSLTARAFRELVASHNLPHLVELDSAAAIADRTVALLGAIPRAGVWSVAACVPGIRTPLAAAVANLPPRGTAAATAAAAASNTPKPAAYVASSAALLLKLAATSGLTVAQVSSLRNSFRGEADAEGQMGRENFVRVLCATLPSVDETDAARLFSTFDTDSSGRVSFSEFIVGMAKVARGAVGEKIALLWPELDGRGGGKTVSAVDLKRVLERGTVEASVREAAARKALVTLFTSTTSPRAFVQIGSVARGGGGGTSAPQPPIAAAAFAAAVNTAGDGALEFLERLCARPAAGVLARALADVAPFLLVARGTRAIGADALSGGAGDDPRAVVRDAFARTPICAVNVASAQQIYAASQRNGAPARFFSREDIVAALVFAFWNDSTTPRSQESAAFTRALDDFFVALMFAAGDFGVADSTENRISVPSVLFSLSITLARGAKDLAKALTALLDSEGEGKVSADAANAWVTRVVCSETVALASGARFLEGFNTSESSTGGDDAHATLRAVLSIEPSLVNAFALAFSAPSARAAPPRPPPVISIARTPSLTSAKSPALTSATSPTLSSTRSPALSSQPPPGIPPLDLLFSGAAAPPLPLPVAVAPASPSFSFGAPLSSPLESPRSRAAAPPPAPSSRPSERRSPKTGGQAAKNRTSSSAALFARRVELTKTLALLESSTTACARSAKRAEEDGRGAIFDAAAALEAASRRVRTAGEARKLEAAEAARRRPASAAGLHAKPAHASRGSALAAVRAAQAAVGTNAVGLTAKATTALAATSLRTAGLYTRPAHGLADATPRPASAHLTFKLN
jgi:Ca2+-binding EF-hand superfamily protein